MRCWITLSATSGQPIAAPPPAKAQRPIPATGTLIRLLPLEPDSSRAIRPASSGIGPGEFDPARPVVVYCAGGYRSSIAVSLLRASGFADVSDLIGGYQAWLAA